MSVIALITLVVTLVLLAGLPSGAFPATAILAAVLLPMVDASLALLGHAPGTDPAPRGARAVPLVFTAILIVLLVNLLPLPRAISGLGNAQRRAQNEAVHEAVETARALDLHQGPAASSFALTRNRAGSLRWTLIVIGAASAMALAARLGPTAKGVHLRVLTLMGAAMGVAGYISLRHVPQGFTLWWIFSVPEALPGPVAAFRNRNHFAAFIAMLAPAAVALLVRDLARGRILGALISLVTLACMGAGLVASLSRGAMLACAVGLAVSVGLLLASRRWAYAALAGLIAAAVIAAVLYAPIPALRERLATFRNLRTDDSFQTRTDAWRDSAAIMVRYPILGAGANGFRLVYPQHRTTTQGALMTHAENEYVQLAVDGGLVGLLLLAALLVAAGWAGGVPVLRDRNRATLAVASLGGLCVVATNALFDYPLHVPLYTIPAATLLGLILPVPVPRADSPLNRMVAASPAVLNLLAAVAIALLGGRRLALDEPDAVTNQPASALARILQWAPTSPFGWLALGEVAAAARTPETGLFARQCVDRATACDPNNYRLWERVGYLKMELGDTAGARSAFARVKELRSWRGVPLIPEGAP